MSVTLDLSQDYAVFDGLAAATYYPVAQPEVASGWSLETSGAPPQIVSYDVPHARIEKIAVRQIAVSAGVVAQADTRFRLPAAEVAGFAPKMGDLIEDGDGNHWTVLEIGLPRFGNSYSCFCRRLWLDATLRDTVTVHVATVANYHGSKKTAHAASGTLKNIPCRIQPMDETERAIQARLGFEVDYFVLTIQDIDVRFNDLFVDDATGQKYEIKRIASRKTLENPITFYCRQLP